MFEKSLEENPYKMIPGLRNEPASISMKDIVLSKFDYSKLDIPNNLVKIKLNSTVVNVTDPYSNVNIGYLDKKGKLHRVQAKHTVMAGYNMMIPHILSDMSQEQKKSLSANVKAGIVYSKVIIRNWNSFYKLGVHEIYVPKMPYSRVKLDYPVNTVNEGRLNGKFRSTDIRWSPQIHRIEQVLLKPGFVPMYLDDGDNVARTKQQLSPVKGNEKPPDPKYIRGTPEHYIISGIVDKRKRNNKDEYKVSWKGFTNPNDNTWILGDQLNRTADLREMKREFNREH
jgi:hypothetical protein